MTRATRLGLAAALTAAGFMVEAREGGLTADAIIERLNRAERDAVSTVLSYSAVRTYTMNQKRLGKPAEMRVRIRQATEGEKQFEILAMSEASGMQKKIFEKLLEGEAESSRKFEQMRMDQNNYSFRLLGEERKEGRDCWVLELKPKRKSKLLIEGKAWVSKEDFGLMRIEGRPTERISFWVGKPQITQTFCKVGGLTMMATNRSLAEVRFMGTAELQVRSSGFELNYRQPLAKAGSRSRDRSE